MLFVSFIAHADKLNSDREININKKPVTTEWKYVQLQRYITSLEASIKNDTQWAVFETNDEVLWSKVRNSVSGMLNNEWRNGRLMGTVPDQAYFVTCNRSTMTQSEIDNGLLVCQIGFAPVKPAEFIVFRLQHNTATSPVR